MARAATRLLLLLAALSPATAEMADAIVREALAAEAQLDTEAALALFLRAEALRPDDAFILQRIARHYSDSEVDAEGLEEKRRFARRALEYSERAYALDPDDPEIVLSLAISHGKVALHGDMRTKVASSRLVKENAERALALDAGYDWAHHVLGRWHYEVAALGPPARFVVKLIYGGLPDASAAEAVRHLERAVELAPQTVAHHVELGFAYLAAGRADEARMAFERGLALPAREKHDEAAQRRAEAALLRQG